MDSDFCEVCGETVTPGSIIYSPVTKAFPCRKCEAATETCDHCSFSWHNIDGDTECPECAEGESC